LSIQRPRYPRIYRIPHPSGYRHGGKRYLTYPELLELFNGVVHVEEKLDGAQFSVMREGGEIVVYQRGTNVVDGYEPGVYRGIWRLWVYPHYEKLQELPEHYVLYGEYLRIRHTVPYDRLPDWAVVFDVYDLERQAFLGYEEKIRVIMNLGLEPPPLLKVLELSCRSERDVDEVIRELAGIIEGKSAFSTEARSMEGAVVKNYAKGLFAKIINPWFDVEVDEHKLFEKGVKYNSLNRQPGVRGGS